MTQPRCLHIDQSLASYRLGDLNVLVVESSTQRVNHKCLHSHPFTLESFGLHRVRDLSTGLNLWSNLPYARLTTTMLVPLQHRGARLNGQRREQFLHGKIHRVAHG